MCETECISGVCVGVYSEAKNALETMNSVVDDELTSLLDSFPLTVPVPDWYDVSNGGPTPPNEITKGKMGIESEKEDSHSQVVTASPRVNHKWTLGSCNWNNMPGIC